MLIVILAKSSSDTPYDVMFACSDNRLTVTCNCKAGIFGQLCKHKTELLAGDSTRLFDVSEQSKLDSITTIVARAPDVATTAAEIAETEKVIKAAQSKIKGVKKRFETMLNEGLQLNPA